MSLPKRFAETVTGACAGINAAELQQMWSCFEAVTLMKGEVLLRQGTLWDQVIFVDRGMLRMYFAGSDGREFNKNFYRENALIFPLTVSMQREQTIFEIAALERSLIWQMPLKSFQRHLEQMDGWAPLRSAFMDHLLTSKLKREHELLTLNGQSRYRKLCEDEPELARRVPMMHLASFMGMTNVSLSRIRRSADHALLNNC